MKLKTLQPIAFIGPNAETMVQRLYNQEAKFLPVAVPTHSNLREALDGLAPLGFLGAILDGPNQREAFTLVSRRTPLAERDGAIDAVSSFGKSTEGTSTTEDALLHALEASGYRGMGGNALVLGDGPIANAAIGLARAGIKNFTFAASTQPAADRLARNNTAGVINHALALQDNRIQEAFERADLVLHAQAGAEFNAQFLQPFHMFVEAATETMYGVAAERAGSHVIPFARVAAHNLAAQLEFVTGFKFDAGAF